MLASCLALAVVLTLPGLFLGLFMDDYFHLATLEKLTPFGDMWSLFGFASGDASELIPRIRQGVYPWYTLPQVKISFMRPLSCALHWADLALFGRNYVLWHAHSVVWYLLLITGWWLVLRKSVPDRLGALALVVFTLDPVHWFPAVWLANRNALVAVAPAVLGLYMHIRWRSDGFRWGLPLSLVGYATGLLGGESALGVFAYIGAYEAFAVQDRPARRFLALAPAAILGAAYLALYKMLGYGSFGSGSYIDPLHEPLDYAAQAPARALMLVAVELAGLPADVLVFVEGLRPVHAAVGLVAMIAFVCVLKKAWPQFAPDEQKALKWASCGALLSLAPVVATFPTNRLLLVPSLGASLVVAAVIARWWDARKIGDAGGVLTALAVVLIAVHLVLAPLHWVFQSLALTYFNGHAIQASLKAELTDEPQTRYVVLPGTDPVTSIYTHVTRAVLEHRPLRGQTTWLVLSHAPHAHRVTRTHPDRLEVEVIGGRMLDSEFERLFRSPRYPLMPGDAVDLGYAEITVLETIDNGPTRLAVEFDKPLDDPSLVFLNWQGDHLGQVRIPPVGGSLELPWDGGLLRLPISILRGVGRLFYSGGY